MFKLKSSTSLRSIREQIADDFGIEVDNDFAGKLRDDHRKGTVLWDDHKLIDVAQEHNVTITPGHIRVNGASYTADEWKRFNA